MKKKLITLGATVALVMSMGTAALTQPADPGSNGFNDPQLHAGHWGYVQSNFKAKDVPAITFHDPDRPTTPEYRTGVGVWSEYVRAIKQGGPNK